MALQLRRGTNAERLAMTPLPGELIMVTDYVSAGVPALWIGDLAGTPGGVVAASQSLDDLTDVTITSETRGDLLTYNGTEWVNNNVISTTDSNNRLTAEYATANANDETVSALIVRKNYLTTGYTNGSGTAVKLAITDTAQGQRDLATLNATWNSTDGPTISFAVTADNGDTFSTPLNLKAAQSTFNNNVVINGNLSQTGNTLTIDSDSSGGDSRIYFKGTTAEIRYDSGQGRFELNKDIIANGVQGGNIQIGLSNDNQIYNGSTDLRIDTQAGYSVLSNAPIKTSAESITINSDNSANDSSLYFNGTTAEIRYDRLENRFEMNKELLTDGVQGGNVQIGMGNANNVIYIGGDNLYLQTANTGYNVVLNTGLQASGIISTDAASIKINSNGDATESFLYFKGTDEYLKWNNSLDGFYLSNDFAVNGSLKLYGDNISNSAGNPLLSWSGQAVTVPGSLAVSGNLTVSGTTTTVNSETVTIADNIIQLNSNITTGTPIENAGVEVRRGSSNSVQWQWNEANKWWEAAGGAVDNSECSIWAPNKIIAGTTLATNGNDIYFNNEEGGSGATSTIHVKRGSNANVALRWNETDDVWEQTRNGTNYYKLPNQNLDTTNEPSFYGLTAGYIQVGISPDGTITTTTGDLTLDSNGGNLRVNDNTIITGTLSVSSTTSLNGNVNLGSDNADTITLKGNLTGEATATTTLNGDFIALKDTQLGNANTDTLHIYATQYNHANVQMNNDLDVYGDIMLGNTNDDSVSVGASGINFTDNGLLNYNRGVSGTVGGNDWWKFGGGATGSNAGYAEIATGDDGTEPIYARQYTNAGVARTLTLLDGSGNTALAGDLTVGGNGYIYSPSDLAIDLDGANVRVVGNLKITGNIIKASDDTTAITLNGANVDVAGNLDANDATFTNMILDNRAGFDTGTATTTATTTIPLITTGRRSMKVLINAFTATANHTVEALVMRDPGDPNGAQIAIYGELKTGASLATFTADYDSVNSLIRVLATPASTTSTTFNVVRTSLS